MHRGGVDEFMQEMTRRVAAAGFFGISPDLYHRQDPNPTTPLEARTSQLRDIEVIPDVNAAVDFLQRQRTVRRESIGIMGFCMGGRVVFLMATVNPALTAAVAFYGGNTMASWGEGPTAFQRLPTTYCPVLGFFGEDDQNPSPEDMRKLDAELTRHKKPHEFHSYPGAAHAYMNFTNKVGYREHAAKASWPITLAFLEKHLGRVPAAR
jgi:carboxymethylenebutenolidase